ncbi:hypothetical protein MMB17_15505 [Methylobacterium organophilum]|uniref:YciI family protein n=1 Tax=Methylobacterium organophilum TaxID=410 RepID=UPI001F1347BF|nr:hypothetical protein [Methylobacterium organophilum]UMY16122.1 hypothetical protein MMB17_15505 [Methylobacterium organophilum]
MFVVILRFSAHRNGAAALMEGHNAWIRRGFEDGVFLVAGSLRPPEGGAILAHNLTRPDLEDRLAEDPFVAEGVVGAEIIEIAPGRTDDRLAFLKA